MIWQLAGFFMLQPGTAPEPATVEIYDYEIVRTYPHDNNAYTQGLFFLNGELFESTGLYAESTIRKVDLETGDVLQKKDLADKYFGEGIVQWEDKIIGLTWRSETGFVFNRANFETVQNFEYSGEGWGLTQNGEDLIMSDGTAYLRFLDPETFKERRRIKVTFKGSPVPYLNELEWINGEVFANIYKTNVIARIDPNTGVVSGLIDMSGLLPPEDYRDGHTDVLNGIAYDAENSRLFVTGKRWPKLFEIKLSVRQ